jgi:hypothetical protein
MNAQRCHDPTPAVVVMGNPAPITTTAQGTANAELIIFRRSCLFLLLFLLSVVVINYDQVSRLDTQHFSDSSERV